MKYTRIILIVAAMVILSGCVSQSPAGSSPSGSGITLPSSSGPLVSGKALPMDGHTVHNTGNTTVEVWIDSFEIGEVQENGDQELTIYVAAKNTGEKPVQLVWFSKLTDMNGKTYGGIGISHGGNGARPAVLQHNQTDMARDYVNIRSDRDLETLKKGAVLDVYFMEKFADDVPVSDIPDYHTTWTIDAGAIR